MRKDKAITDPSSGIGVDAGPGVVPQMLPSALPTWLPQIRSTSATGWSQRRDGSVDPHLPDTDSSRCCQVKPQHCVMRQPPVQFARRWAGRKSSRLAPGGASEASFSPTSRRQILKRCRMWI